MPKDTEYADLLETLTLQHQQRLSDSLERLEKELVGIMSKAPLVDGNLHDLGWAVGRRIEIKAAIEATYLTEVQNILKGYQGIATSTYEMLGEYSPVMKLNPRIITQLQSLSFKGFEAIANEYLDVIATEVYQSTLTNRAFTDSVKTIQQTINGVYIKTNDAEAQKLVEIAKTGTAAQSADAVEKLHSLYARDRVGNNLRRYSQTYAQDSLMQFDASVNTAIGKEAGATKWKYYGGTSSGSRQFCRDREGNIYTDEEIADLWAGSWAGKSSSDAMIARGGYNCQHHWRPVF
jgi:hypothetical protein